MHHHTPISTLFPYTTLFRSHPIRRVAARQHGQGDDRRVRIGLEARAQLEPQRAAVGIDHNRSEEHTSELQSHHDLVCRLLLEKKKYIYNKSSNECIEVELNQ